MPWVVGFPGVVIPVHSDALNGRVAGCRDSCGLRCPGWGGRVSSRMDSNALDGRVAGRRNPHGLQCSGRTGGRVSSVVMDSNALDERVTGYRPPL